MWAHLPMMWALGLIYTTPCWSGSWGAGRMGNDSTKFRVCTRYVKGFNRESADRRTDTNRHTGLILFSQLLTKMGIIRAWCNKMTEGVPLWSIWWCVVLWFHLPNSNISQVITLRCSGSSGGSVFHPLCLLMSSFNLDEWGAGHCLIWANLALMKVHGHYAGRCARPNYLPDSDSLKRLHL